MSRTLIEKILHGDTVAFDELSGHYSHFVRICIQKALRQYSFWPGREDVEDLHSAFFMGLMENDFKKLRQFEGRSSFETYLNVIAIRQVVDFLRKQRHPLSIDDESVDPSLLRDKATPADRQLEMSEDEKMVAKAIRSLPPPDRILLNLLIYKGLSPLQICKIMNISILAYYNRKSRIFKRLKEMCEKLEPSSSIRSRR